MMWPICLHLFVCLTGMCGLALIDMKSSISISCWDFLIPSLILLFLNTHVKMITYYITIAFRGPFACSIMILGINQFSGPIFFNSQHS